MTVREIAKIAGVSASTVSCVLNSRPGVGETKRQEIIRLLTENGYRIKSGMPRTGRAIRLLRYRSSDHLLDSHDGFFSKILDGVDVMCHRTGCTLSVASADKATLPNVLELAAEDKIDGLLFLGSEYEMLRAGILADQPLPVVSIDNRFPEDNIDCVDMDNWAGVNAAISHLYRLGHKKIGYLKSAVQIGSMRERTAGFRQAMAAHGLTFEPSAQEIALFPLVTRAYDGLSAYLRAHTPCCTAYFAGNDSVAAGAIRAFQQAGYRVPEDISVIGFDDAALCLASSPQITTIRIFHKTIGEQAAARLLARMAQPEGPALRVSVAVELVERESTGKASER